MSDRLTSTPFARRALVLNEQARTRSELRQPERDDAPPATLLVLRCLGFLTLVLYFWVLLQAL